MTARSLRAVLPAPRPHWVGDGFLVSPLFGDLAFSEAISPFLMLDWAPEHHFPPAPAARGVGPHPHRGFETVTIVHAGEVVHRDSAGHGGRIGPGDVQWMTAGGGLEHEEMHADALHRDGGPVSMAQLWVNLPSRSKRVPPRYQPILATEIPVIDAPDHRLRLVAGDFADRRGPAATHTPLTVIDGHLAAGAALAPTFPDGWTVLIAVLDGEVSVAGRSVTGPAVAVLDRRGDTVPLAAHGDAHVLLLAGEPIDEPIAHMGPFVMNTREELIEAVADWRAGRMGRLD